MLNTLQFDLLQNKNVCKEEAQPYGCSLLTPFKAADLQSTLLGPANGPVGLDSDTPNTNVEEAISLLSSTYLDLTTEENLDLVRSL